ncbi:MAG: hypothetical protein V2I57_00325 [Xanthomonadales bacterium]|jgi:hypothetical protein|nr:hypothetical protein [Xanthomonadales bacterium]
MTVRPTIFGRLQALLLVLSFPPVLMAQDDSGAGPTKQPGSPEAVRESDAPADDQEDGGWEDEGQNDGAWEDGGWGDDDWDDTGWEEDSASPWTGFVELGYGQRWERDPAVGRYATLGELRWRVERTWQLTKDRFDLRVDLLADGVVEDAEAELRELAWARSFGPSDLRVGRQVLTWGTGDLLFLNDLFPKGWQSFFIGRDDEYLKQPADAIRLTTYTDAVNIDLVAMPRFNPDEYLSGERLSFFFPPTGVIVAPNPPIDAREPSASLSNTEWAGRLFRTIGGNELAVYGFSGFFHQPAPAGENFAFLFPELDALGASWRRPLGPGLFNAEFARYYSVNDRSGTNPLIPNDQERYLLGYEWEAVTNLTVGFQAYLERTLDHDELLANSPWPEFEVEENRWWLTNRLTWRTRQDRVIWSLFTFYSPTDDDAYLRPQVSWRVSDTWSLSAGGNLFAGDEDFTFFNQFQDNSNVYARLRFSY